MNLADLLMERGVLKNADAQKLAAEIEARFAKEGFIRASELDKTIELVRELSHHFCGTTRERILAELVRLEALRK